MATAVLYPVFAQIILTLVLMLAMGLKRQAALRNGEVTTKDIAVDSSRWPDHTRKFANCYRNQFELPVLFYVLCLIAHSTRTADLIFVILAWIFVVFRIIHAYIHTGSNIVAQRGAVFSVGYVVIVIMTAFLLFRLLVPPTV